MEWNGEKKESSMVCSPWPFNFAFACLETLRQPEFFFFHKLGEYIKTISRVAAKLFLTKVGDRRALRQL